MRWGGGGGYVFPQLLNASTINFQAVDRMQGN